MLLSAAGVMCTAMLLDAGLARAAKVSATGVARQPARAGAPAIDLHAGRRHFTLRLPSDEARIRAHPSRPTTGGAGTVRARASSVTVSVTVRPCLPFPGRSGVQSRTVTVAGLARPVRGVDTAEP
ncbi:MULTISPECIES: hypothetical protein [unclassified Streptomyces]|uniref:hypothetical protein n=1 Tax=unclassified Streptomyces TaxID=2593676 RepID=UPI0033206B75